MFNLSGSEIVVIVLLALIVLGPEKLPEAIRRFGRVYGELKRMSTGFQSEFRNAFDEPMREFRETAQLTKDAVMRPVNEVRDTFKEVGAGAGRTFDEAAKSDPKSPSTTEKTNEKTNETTNESSASEPDAGGEPS